MGSLPWRLLSRHTDHNSRLLSRHTDHGGIDHVPSIALSPHPKAFIERSERPNVKRRHLLHGMSLLVAGTLGGCSRSEPQVRTSTPTGSDRPASTSTATDTETRTTSPTADVPIYVSEVFANPEGPDANAVSDEYVLVEVNADTEQDLSGYTLAYGTQHEYVFPDPVSAVEPGANVDVSSGHGSDEVSGAERPTYTLFVGSDTPLLANGGMRLTLRDPAGETVDSVTYGAMAEGTLYARPET